MTSPVDADFTRTFQPLPPRDRRLLLREMQITGVDHRDEDAFYEWLAERYRTGEAWLVDRALSRCCAKADERGSSRRMIAWLKARTGIHEPADSEPARAIAVLVETARRLPDDTAAILDALTPNFPWLSDQLEDVTGAEVSFELGEEVPQDEAPECPVGDDDAVAVLDRLRAALINLDKMPQAELIDQAKGLAVAIERHVAEAASREAEFKGRRESLAASLQALDATLSEAFAGLGDRLRANMLTGLEQSLLTFQAAAKAVDVAQGELRDAAGADRARRKAADARLDEAEEALEEVRGVLAERIQRAADAPGETVRHGLSRVHSEERSGEVGSSDGGIEAKGAHPEQASDADPEIQLPTLDEPDSSSVLPTSLEASDPEEAAREPEGTPAAAPAVAETVPQTPESERPDTNWTALDTDSNPGEASPWDDWLRSALVAGRLGLAVHLADARRLAGADERAIIPHVAVEALLSGSRTQAAYDRAWQDYDSLQEPLLAATAFQEGAAGPTAASLILYAGAIRPAILQSVAGWSVLESLDGGMAAALNPLTLAVRDLRDARIASFAELQVPAGEEEKRSRMEDVRRELEQWWNQAKMRTTSFQRATLVWQALVSPEGPIGRACACALADGTGAAKAVEARIAPLHDDIDAEIARVHESLTKRARLDPIEGNALKQLKNLIAGAIEHLERWLRARGLAAGEDRHHVRRAELMRALTATRQAVAGLTADKGDLAPAAILFDAAARDLSEQLGGQARLPLTPSETLDWEIALLPNFPLNARRGLRLGADDVEPLFQAAAAIAQGMLSPTAAFERALAIGAASSAARLIPHLPAEQRAAAEEALAETVRSERKRLEERARGLRSRLDDLQIALTENRPEVDELEREMTAFEQVRPDELPRETGEAGDWADFPTAHRELGRIERKLELARAPVRQRLEQRIEVLEGDLGQRLDECRTQLADGDLGTLAEELDQIARYGLAGPPEGTPLALLRHFIAIIENLGDSPTLQFGNLPRAAREGRREGAFDYSELPVDDRARAERVLAAWNELRRAVVPQPRSSESATKMRKAVAEVLTALRFTGVRVEACDRQKAWFHLTVSVDPLRSRELCLVPAFGSERAKPHESVASYAVAVVGAGDVASALSLFESLPNQVLLLVTEPLTPRQRRDFQRKARAGSRAVALADALTVAALARTPLAGPRQFFDLAIPFGAAQPYADQGSETSIEMFFGREDEMQRLVDPNGACFVYGGRQLGKTALLKQVEMRENASPDRVAIYCDIKPVGESSPTEQVWRDIADKLRDRKLSLPDGATTPERLRAWLEARPGRYLLILLDEADAFLEREMSDNFPIVGEMKDLMAQTRRGVKFVFAGLHNVQRFYRAPNSPLLHLGAPINVGPLLGNDREAAREMAFEPMAALGFEFARRTDAYYMLSLVGFYPSLMQTFGKAVVQGMNDRLKRVGDAGEMPAVITRGLIEGCFERQTFRDSVVERFRQTLKLDERYELITYAVWQHTQEDNLAGRPATHGYPASEIFRLAMEWWPAGFRDTDSLDSFSAILDEMFEMGVLAREGERYALRSQRIAAMLGGKAEIDDQLLGLTERAPRRRPDPLTSHRQIGKGWSPLSLRQEGTLRSRWASPDGPPVTLIAASAASGHGRIAEAIETLAAELGWPPPRALEPGADPDKIAASVDVRRETGANKPRILLKEGTLPEPHELSELRRHRAFRDAAHPVRLVCYGPPSLAALSDQDDADLLRIVLGPLPLDAMFHWMNRWHLAFAGEETAQAQLREVSGGFVAVLNRLAPTAAERDDLARLLQRAEQAARSLSPADLDLDGQTEAFARKLLAAIGAEQIEDASDWAREVDEVNGERLARLLEVLGVLERTASASGGVLRGFNPVARRLLS